MPKRKAKPARDPEAMTGGEFAAVRTAADPKVTQADMAELIGVGLRTVIRFEGQANRRRDIPLSVAKLVRCLVRQKRL